MSRKRKVLTWEERVSVIKKVDSGSWCRAIAAEIEVGKTHVQTIVKEKEDTMKRWEAGESMTIWTRLCGNGLQGLDKKKIYQ